MASDLTDSGRDAASIRVLQSFRLGRSTTNPYLSQLVRSFPAGVEVQGFSWRSALIGQWDVVHVHWPDVLLRGSDFPRTVFRRLCFFLLMLRLRGSRERVLVRTLHNESAHEVGASIERRLVTMSDRTTALWIRLNTLTKPPTDAPVRTILHGDYRPWFADVPRHDAVPGRVLSFGLIRRYKGVEDLIAAFRSVSDESTSLRIVGKPNDGELAAEIGRLLADAARASGRLEFVEDSVLADEILDAELVVLPYRRMHNSGALLLALSLGRPVLVPDNPITRELATEVGPGWVYTFQGELSAAALDSAIEAAHNESRTEPNLAAREWSAIGAAHAAAYRDALKRRKRSK